MSRLKEYFSYKKFDTPVYRILYLNNDYYLQKQSIAALKNLGHDVAVVDVVNDPSQMLELILKTAILLKPDCVMGVNHLGFDEEGKIADLLSQLSIPVVFWYLDDFRFIAFDGKVQSNPMTAIFTFEKTHVPVIKELGFSHVFHLPSASAIHPEKDYLNQSYSFLENAVSFIGGTFSSSKNKRLKPAYPDLLFKLEKKIDFKHANTFLIDEIKREQAAELVTENEFNHYAGYVMCEAIRQYRANILENVVAENFHVFGDLCWNEYSINGTIHGPVDNTTAVPFIFHHSLLNLNISSQQLATTVNLRVFEVPAAGGFLLTDWKDELGELFDFDSELVVYKSIDEMNDLIAFYQQNPSKREHIINKARQRVLKEHLVIHRIRKMISVLADLFG